MNTILLNTIPLDGGKVIVKGGGAQLNNQAKTIEITENGTTEVTYDTGFTGLSKVTINTNVQGGVVAASVNDVNFRDYDGTILHSYTKDEFLALSALPPLPTQDGLICQEWNWDFADAQEYVAEYGRLEVGATYITDDGKTRIYIDIDSDGRLNVPLCFSQSVANGVSVDWGDGSAVETFGRADDATMEHQYERHGDYVITLDVKDGCDMQIGSNSTGFTLFGSSNRGTYYHKMVTRVEIGKGVSTIRTGCFGMEMNRLLYVIIPNNVKLVKNITNCYALLALVLPKGCEFDGSSEKNYSLSAILFPQSATQYSSSKFRYNYALKTLVFPPNITKIPDNCFNYCYTLSNVVIPNTVTTIGLSAFSYCSSLHDVNLPESITQIGSSAFEYCNSIQHITFPENVGLIGGYAFNECRGLVSCVFKNVNTIGASSFAKCSFAKCYDFRASAAVPTLSNTNAFSSIPSDCKIVVPDALYDEWIAATNWSTYASYIVKASVFNGEAEEVIEYHFELEMDDIIGSSSGYVEGDYSEAYNKLSAFIINNTNADQDVVEGDVLSQNINITVNGDQVIRLRHYAEYNEVEFATDAPAPMGGGWDGNASGYIRATSLGYEKEGGF